MTTHLTTDSSGRTRCCGKTVDKLPLSDGFTMDEGRLPKTPDSVRMGGNSGEQRTCDA